MPRFEQFRLPDAGEGLTEAEIVAWHVAVGDTVEINQPILEIETAKSLVELPCPFAGVVTELLAEPGTTVEVGTAIITIDTDPGGDPAEPGGTSGAASSAGTGTSSDGAPSADDEPSGAVLVGYGVAGHSASRRPRRAADVPVAVQEAPAQEAPPRDTPAPAPATPAPAPRAASAPAPAATSPAGQPARATTPVLAKPPVRKLAKDLGVDLDTVSPSGPGGIVTREDVVARSRDNQPQALATYVGDDQPWLASGTVADDGRTTRVPVKSVRKRTAEAMVASAFTAPHVSVFHTVDVTKTMRLVARLREDREFADVRVTPLLIAMKALLIAVNRHPEVNASWQDETQEIVYKHYVNLGIAAQTPRGLIVPNIKDAHRRSLHDLAVALADLTATARAGRTTPSDMTDGTITVTNVGVFGIDTGTPILNPGESAILAFGAIRQQPWVHKGKIRVRHVTQLALSFDHRLIDGGLGSRLLADVAAVLEEPGQGLVWS
ncbi:dihydrolipoamide acetyltransferase family protein [Actinotalea sp. K2]|uniref:dihydrolipoamide acetyltransferase family protein n=1 Tax=Actinotalea sp. K2 TaxID=2939438 RepID=UPI002017928F|nr:dihydrolipoamide acetyltransferase family protein [Actinotalea sp. K2]MCL3861663.1 2-oxo acid dehydrogenase subunit E2 [Actinotalea sp. K2]